MAKRISKRDTNFISFLQQVMCAGSSCYARGRDNEYHYIENMASSAGGQLKRANFFLSQRDAVMKVNGSVSQRPDSGSGSLRFTYISRQPFFLSVTQLLRVPDSLQQLLKDLCVAFNKSILAVCTAEGGRVLDVDLIRYGRLSDCLPVVGVLLAPSLYRAFRVHGRM